MCGGPANMHPCSAKKKQTPHTAPPCYSLAGRVSTIAGVYNATGGPGGLPVHRARPPPPPPFPPHQPTSCRPAAGRICPCSPRAGHPGRPVPAAKPGRAGRWPASFPALCLPRPVWKSRDVQAVDRPVSGGRNLIRAPTGRCGAARGALRGGRGGRGGRAARTKCGVRTNAGRRGSRRAMCAYLPCVPVGQACQRQSPLTPCT